MLCWEKTVLLMYAHIPEDDNAKADGVLVYMAPFLFILPKRSLFLHRNHYRYDQYSLA